MEMEERVAQALFDRECERSLMRGRIPHHAKGSLVTNMPPSYRDDYMADARAVIETMREPTATMLKGGIEVLEASEGEPSEAKVTRIWWEMIYIALPPTPNANFTDAA